MIHHRLGLLGALGLVAALSAPVLADAATAGASPNLEHFRPGVVDRALDPCDDFNQFVCSSWLAANPIPADQERWSTNSPIRIWNETVLREVLESAAAGTTSSPADRKIGDYWAACMDEAGADAAGLKQLAPHLARVAALRSKRDLAAEVARIHHLFPGAWLQSDNQTDAALFGITGQQDYDDASTVVAQIDQGGLTLPGRDYYLGADARSFEIRTKYRAHVKKMLMLAGRPAVRADADASAVLAIETALARAQMDNVKRRDPKNLNNKMTLAQVRALTPSFDWTAYLAAVKAPPSAHYVVTSPDFFHELEKQLRARPLEQWKAYLRWQLVHGAAPTLGHALDQENFALFGRTLRGLERQLPRWRRCVHAADRDLGEALGQAYVERAFPPESKARMVELVRAVETALGEDVRALPWMTLPTKERALAKLAAIVDKIGYPSRWRDYSAVRVTRTSYLANVAEASSFELERWIAKIGKPVDREEWLMTPPTLNAYYDAQLNTINFPAGILQPPLFDPEQDDAVNYGAIGSIIGHEIIHGFDDQGRKFDAQGNLRDWWSAEDARRYEERGRCISDQYTQDVPQAGPRVRQNGLLTQGEDTADNGGVRLALAALEAMLTRRGVSLDAKGPDGWTPRQRYFLAYGFAWCTAIRPEMARLLVTTNPHSLPVFRVNNVLSNLEEFREAFACKPGQRMVRANACRVW